MRHALAGRSVREADVKRRTGVIVVAIKRADGWLLHCGDAYFHHGEVHTPAHCPTGLRAFQVLNQTDGAARRQNRERLRELAQRHGPEVELICSHDASTLARDDAPGR